MHVAISGVEQLGGKRRTLADIKKEMAKKKLLPQKGAQHKEVSPEKSSSTQTPKKKSDEGTELTWFIFFLYMFGLCPAQHLHSLGE